MNDYVLCVIDMQPGFGTSKKRNTIQQCASLVKQAVQDKARVIIVELAPDINGSTYDEIMLELNGYQNWQYIEKMFQSGADEFDQLTFLKRDTHIKFCGVNTCACVGDTYVDL